MLPERFKERMKKMLGDSYPAFEAALGEENVRAIRVNTTKIDVDDFLQKTALSLTPISYAEDGFIPKDAEGIGRTAEHHAGMFYVQDPGAMATVKALEVKEGWSVLDACSAPGGKASQLASAIGDHGFLLANEYVPKRAKIIVSNFERLGIKNAIVTSLDTANLSNMFKHYFDLVLCDAPCSGEGMFRKYDEALTEWSEDNVKMCAERQSNILNNLSELVKPGGYLLYSTCTYSYEENEAQIRDFLSYHADFSLYPVSPELHAVTADGLDGFEATRRFYPHIEKGEGQFIALMKKDENSDNMPTILYKEKVVLPSKQEIAIVEEFIKDNMTRRPDGRIILWGEELALIPHNCPLPPYSVFMPGVVLGKIKGKVFFPHHQLFSAYGNMFVRQVNLTREDPRTARYLRGEEIDVDEADNGWCTVFYEGVALGGGKISQGRMKNHYPKGLRNN